MKKMLHKELKLATSPLTWIFLAAGFMTMLPGYPILVGAFFICFGIFHSYQLSRESNDTLYSVLLPVPKRDYVCSKYVFTVMFQMIGFCVTAVLTVIRMTVLSAAEAYVQNALMNATPVYLAFELLVYAAFNLFFVGGFFRTAYKIGIPFLKFGIAVFVIIAIAETLHHIPSLKFLNTTSGDRMGLQLILLAAAAAVYGLVTVLACKRSCRKFEQIDL